MTTTGERLLEYLATHEQDSARDFRALSRHAGSALSSTWDAVQTLKRRGLVVDGRCGCCGGPTGPRLTVAGWALALSLIESAVLDSESNDERRERR